LKYIIFEEPCLNNYFSILIIDLNIGLNIEMKSAEVFNPENGYNTDDIVVEDQFHLEVVVQKP
jgi:hypothetical protein